MSMVLHAVSKRRLRAWLALLMLALAVPTGILIWQAYSQLKWEAFHHYRGQAEELTTRIDGDLAALVAAAEKRTFADYSFLVVEGDPDANFLQRSPLSELQVEGDLPGVLGYFQVDDGGQFSTPLLPSAGTAPKSLGITSGELERRHRRAEQVLAILSANSLVEPGSAPVPSAALEPGETQSSATSELRRGTETDADRYRNRGQAAFDALSSLRANQPPAADAEPMESDVGQAAGNAQALGKVADLNLETPFRDQLDEAVAASGLQRQATDDRSTRKERSMLLEAPPPTAEEEYRFDASSSLRIDTFESEIEPLEFSLLDSGHFVLFRKVWRDRERYVQGLLLDSDAFLESAVSAPFRSSVAAGMSDLLVAWHDDVIHRSTGTNAMQTSNDALESPAALLYRYRLSSPLDSLELIYRIRHLPPGPAARVLGWSTLVLAVVFCAGFVALYRLGAGQIQLARQQQDFVSAVSHELKTPLTSIRMYAEMLKEGWAEPGKRQQYYEYIHDESERLTRLIANVLQLASITRNAPSLDIRPVPVAELMQSIETKIANQVQRSGFSLHVAHDEGAGPLKVAIDTDCFMQIIINLVDNAIKFSRKAERKGIEISAGRSGDGQVRFSVRDYGPGVPRAQMKKIFQLFYRSESELTRETTGTGIGLAIVHQLTLSMNGKVDVVNRDPGAEFSVVLPVV
ncbi:MAG TPA: HAMP domain-containing sensor histidine kinase [Woeseiaceae bacterium]|nr:HAMP domain-containing sensor histidine kinase [Woeseiaceae bacterium]